jgi:predicted transcriptional regulator
MDRPDLLVLGRLLEGLALANEPPLRTQLQQRAGVNYTMLERYLEFLTVHGLAVLDGDGRLSLTPKGAEAYRFLSVSLARIFGVPEVGTPLRDLGRGPSRG